MRVVSLTENQCEHVRNGQVEQIVIGWGSHVMSLGNDNASTEIPHQTHDEYDRVDHCDWD